MLQIFNTLAQRKERFKPVNGMVRMFVCGPTVYDRCHIGHARTYVTFDVIAKYIRSKGHRLFFLMNITDIDQKVIQKAKQRGENFSLLARRYEKHFLRDMKALRIDSVDFYARASDYVQEIIGQIKELIKRGYAYETGTGVYFNVRKFPRYGYLSRSRGEISLRPFELCSSKKWPEDFSLWRKSNEEPAWESPWGHGRPGWHIEDTAIAMKFFGSGYDLHGGASELIFPHHEAEIAQAEALTGKRPYVRFWIHTGLLKMRGRKMSKSLGNLIYIKEFLRSNDYRAARFYFLSRHYRQDVSFSTAEVKASARRWSRFIKHLNRFLDLPSSPRRPAQTALYEILKNLEYRFRKDMDDDFNTPAALRTVCRMASVAAEYARRQSSIEYRTKRRALEVIRRPAEILGII